jgi:hypothetical protein
MTRRLHFFRNLRTAFALLVAVAVVAAIGFVLWANHIGLPDTWRARIEREIEKQGFYVSVESLSYQPLQGITAKEIRVFSDESRSQIVSRLERVVLDFDNTKLIQLVQGDVKLKKLQIVDGQLELPMDPADPFSPVLQATDVNATITMPGGRLLEIPEARGRIQGIDINLRAHLLGYRPMLGSPKIEDPNRKTQMDLIRRGLNELAQWTFDEAERPKLTISLDGDLVDRSTLRAQLGFSARKLAKDQRALESVAAEAELAGSLLTVNSFKAKDASGLLEGRGDYDLRGREGRFGATSSLELPGLLHAWFDVPRLKTITLGGAQRVEVAGTFRLPEGKPAEIALTGDASCRSVKIKGVAFDSISTSFAWRDRALYLRDIEVRQNSAVARGKAMWKDRVLRLALESSLPLASCRPFFKGSTFGNVLNDFKETERTAVDVTIGGSIDFENTADWHLTGHARMTHAAYRGTPFNWAQTDLDLSHKALDFLNGTAEFDYRNYDLARAFRGVKTGHTKVKLVRYDCLAKVVVIEGVDGNFWPAPVLRMFAPKIADNLETYRFHTPPNLQVSGLIDVTPKGRTDVKATFRTDDPAEYVFLNRPLTLLSPSGNVRVINDRVTVDQLKFRTFDGPVEAKIAHTQGKVESTLTGEFRWTKLSFDEIGKLYQFDAKGGGDLTGRVEFTMNPGKVATMNGRGLVGLENGELFSVPVFGPLSPLLAGILSDRKAGFQQARDAFCTFTIREGELSTTDFRTGTSSLVFTGDAKVDLSKMTLDMTMRMNARGLLGLITLPLRPFYGLFQFRGQGDLKHPEWENAMFTAPPDEQKDVLLNPPKARLIPEP